MPKKFFSPLSKEVVAARNLASVIAYNKKHKNDKKYPKENGVTLINKSRGQLSGPSIRHSIGMDEYQLRKVLDEMKIKGGHKNSHKKSHKKAPKKVNKKLSL